MWQQHKYGILIAILIILALIALVYMTMRVRLYMHAQESIKESFVQKSASDNVLSPPLIWPNVPWKPTLLKNPETMHQHVVYSMEDNTLSKAQTDYHGNYFGMRFKTPVNVTFDRARIDADRDGLIAFRINEWNTSGEQPLGDMITEKEISVQKGEQWIDLNLSVPGDDSKTYVIWYPKNEINSDVSLKRTQQENMYANARVGPVKFMGGASTQGDTNERWYYLFQLNIAVPLYTFFEKNTPMEIKEEQPIVKTYSNNFETPDRLNDFVKRAICNRGMSGNKFSWVDSGLIQSDNTNNDNIMFLDTNKKNIDIRQSITITLGYEGTYDDDMSGIVLIDKTDNKAIIAGVTDDFNGNVGERREKTALVISFTPLPENDVTFDTSNRYSLVTRGKSHKSVKRSANYKLHYDVSSKMLEFFIDERSTLKSQLDANISSFGIASIGQRPFSSFSYIHATYH